MIPWKCHHYNNKSDENIENHEEEKNSSPTSIELEKDNVDQNSTVINTIWKYTPTTIKSLRYLILRKCHKM